ncbi:MAG: site-specific DNA-methyltransferase [Acidobacteria bacterium]|nr:site-specific DNA-methyltransferase [Acidobacteriota bacterium]
MSGSPTPFATLRPGPHELRFYLDDALDYLRHAADGSVSAVVTSPPYNLGIRYRSFDDGGPRDEYLRWTSAWVAEVARVLARDGSLFLNVGGKPTDPWTALDVAQAARPHLHLQNIIHWIKSIAIARDLAGARSGLADDLAVGHYKPINSNRFLNDCHEFVFHFTPDGRTALERRAIGVKYQDQSNVGRWAGASEGLRCRGNTWFIPYDTIQSRDRERPHPATFPVRLPEQCLKLHGLARLGLVVDPFLGLGSTAVACARLGLAFAGVEMDEHYLREAVARTRQALETPSTMPLRF